MVSGQVLSQNVVLQGERALFTRNYWCKILLYINIGTESFVKYSKSNLKLILLLVARPGSARMQFWYVLNHVKKEKKKLHQNLLRSFKNLSIQGQTAENIFTMKWKPIVSLVTTRQYIAWFVCTFSSYEKCFFLGYSQHILNYGDFNKHFSIQKVYELLFRLVLEIIGKSFKIDT